MSSSKLKYQPPSGSRLQPLRLILRLALVVAAVVLFSYSVIHIAYHDITPKVYYPPDPVRLTSGGGAKTVAAIVETRTGTNLLPIILHFSGVLGPNWPIHVFKGPDNTALFHSSAAVRRLMASGGIVLHDLPTGTAIKTHDDVTALFTSKWLYQSLAPAQHVLFFQTDSILCANSEHRVEDFLKFPLIGAPIIPRYGSGYNGGLSLRHIPSVLRTLEQFPWAQHPIIEDQYFAINMAKLDGIKLPTTEEAMLFSVETHWYDRPMGYHQAQRWNKDRMPEIVKWCPEVLLTEEGALYKNLPSAF
ncbi:hypothetical protein BDZ88DRAFT_420005 [Geranomyces variabilis]|nr:hypothetical protein BDZ88DRAFT_420005 [Geranomyces variabilis]KAJ3135094.1 hypothetical protein HDU90_004125 [Geranomyces variabilis]